MGWFSRREPDVAEHSTLAELIVSDQLQALSLQQSRQLSVAAILRARQMNADTLSSLPVKTGQSLVPAPNSRQDSQEFVAETVLAMQDYGEAYWRLSPNGDLTPLANGDVVVTWNTARTLRLYSYKGVKLRPRGISRNLIVLPVNRGRST